MNPSKWAKSLNHPEVVRARELIEKTYSSRLVFKEDSHQYFLDGNELECVSNIVAKWCSADQDAMLENVAKKAAVDKNYKYYGMTRQQIKKMWDDNAQKACDFGSKCHAFGEEVFHYMTGQTDKEPIPTCPQEEAIVKFWEDIPDSYIPVMAETKVFSLDYHPYAGTFDLLFYFNNEADPSKNGFIIFDYKTNSSLENAGNRNWGNMMKYPFSDLVEEPQSHYILQLGLYQIPLEKLGLDVKARRLIWLTKDGKYEKRQLHDIKGRLKSALMRI